MFPFGTHDYGLIPSNSTDFLFLFYFILLTHLQKRSKSIFPRVVKFSTKPCKCGEIHYNHVLKKQYLCSFLHFTYPFSTLVQP